MNFTLMGSTAFSSIKVPFLRSLKLSPAKLKCSASCLVKPSARTISSGAPGSAKIVEAILGMVYRIVLNLASVGLFMIFPVSLTSSSTAARAFLSSAALAARKVPMQFSMRAIAS